MSINHYIQTQIVFDFEKLCEILSKEAPEISFEQRSNNLCYFWQNKNSTRGVDVSIENGLVELRNTTMSNDIDYLITQFIANLICEVFEGTIFIEDEDNEEDEGIKLVSIENEMFPIDRINEIQLYDASVIKTIIEQTGKHITIDGPIRKVHFGVDFITTYHTKSNEELLVIMHNLIKKVNYELPDYSYGIVMEVGNDDRDSEKKIVTLLRNQVPCVIDKYDYILFQKNEMEIIAITNDDLNTILPNIWTRIDEYTIVAPIISNETFIQLIAKAEKVNKFKDMTS